MSEFVGVYRDDFPALTGVEWEEAMDRLGHDVTAHLNEHGYCAACWLDDGGLVTVSEWLSLVKNIFDGGGRPLVFHSPFGTHGVMYVEDELIGDPCAVVGFNLPHGVYAEIEDGTFGELQGFRFFLGGDGDE